MKNLLNFVFIFLGAIVLILISMMSLSTSETIDEQLNLATLVATPMNLINMEPVVGINEVPFEDNLEIYQNDVPASIVYMYLTVRTGNPSDNTNHTWEEVNSFVKWSPGELSPIVVPKAEAILQIGNENGLIPGELGYAEVVPNATVQIRGASTSRAPQKSYKIELRNRAGDWRDQTTIALNKHPWDISRMMNKLCFDLLIGVPNFVSLRTQFVNLYVKDETTDPTSDIFENYGLFTQVEQPNRRFLRNHFLDGDGQFYKANLFEFYRYPEQIHLIDDLQYNEAKFFTILETKGNQNHAKLIEMLDAVNNNSIPIKQIFEKYFNGENYFTFLAVNILLGNVDTQSQNYYLYSPQNSDKWYFVPWDYDGALSRQNRDYFNRSPYEDWEYGIGNYWGTVLHNRVLRVDEYRNLLTDKIEEMKEYFTPERIEFWLNTYRPVVEPIIFSMPDSYYLYSTKEDYDLFYAQIPTEIQNNYDLYYQSLETSMPFFLGTPQLVGNRLGFNWDESYDFGAGDIIYDFEISRDWEFKDIVYETKLTNLVTVGIEKLEAGTYFWRVIATNAYGNSQYSFDHYIDAEGFMHSGMKVLYITPEGEIFEE